jgi:HEAT repeat protein
MLTEVVAVNLLTQDGPEQPGRARFLDTKMRVVANPVQDKRIVALHQPSYQYSNSKYDIELPGYDEIAPVEYQIARLKENSYEGAARLFAAWRLGKAKREDIVAQLIYLLRNGSEHEQVIAAIVLSRMGKAVFSALAAIAGDTNPVVRGRVMWILGLIGDRKSVEIAAVLENALKDPDHYVRSYAATSLGYVRCPTSIHPLIDALLDESEKVYWFAITALESFGERALNPLLAALYDDREAVRIGAILALGRLMSPRAIPALKRMRQDPSPVVRSALAQSLGWIRSAAALDVLVILLDDDQPQVQMQVVAALGWMRDPRAVEPLIAHVNDDDELVAYAAISALTEIGDRRAIPALWEAMATSMNQRVRSAANHAIRIMSAATQAG